MSLFKFKIVNSINQGALGILCKSHILESASQYNQVLTGSWILEN
jgi:hypothetical protein